MPESTIETADFVLLDHELDDTLKCSSKDPRVCENEAAVLVVHPCCQFAHYLCDDHWSALREHVEFLKLAGTLECIPCKANPAPEPEYFTVGWFR